MTEELIFSTENLYLPIIVFVSAIAIILYLIKKEEKRQLLNDKRYNELTNKFIDIIKKYQMKIIKCKIENKWVIR